MDFRGKIDIDINDNESRPFPNGRFPKRKVPNGLFPRNIFPIETLTKRRFPNGDFYQWDSSQSRIFPMDVFPISKNGSVSQ